VKSNCVMVKIEVYTQAEWVQGRHCPCQTGQQNLQVVACQWTAYTAAVHSCSAAAAVRVMRHLAYVLNKTASNIC